ncbi:hypothetical protein F0U62_20720 [Cystobacter fuscus]|uniref:adventurous gliding motility protein AgmC n=1 Tax=Cystobacter fuscus TaxID=43 RepID=UPI002B2B38F1|nr:hypothetical protein F0U62_20720 [Cystobacter fuscus]
MNTPIIKKWLAAVLCLLALGSTTAMAGPDTFYLGEGTENKTVSVLNTQLNTYAQVTADITANTKSIQVGPAVGAATSIQNDSLIMILQTTGIEPVPVSGDTAPINLNGKPVGTWELARVEKVSDLGSGATLTLKEPLVRGYTKDVTQVIVVAEYATLTVSASTSIIARPWDGKVGGVVALLVKGALTMQGTTSTNRGRISANAAGFRGGAFLVDPLDTPGCSGLDQSSPAGGLKGEGIANTRYGKDHAGRGNVANGGGGGVCSQSGGGGGAGAGTNSSLATGAGAGGMGGNSVDSPPQAGGIGGASLYFTETNRLTFGGGGGAGHGLSSAGQPAGNGGGIIFVRAGSLVGSGRFDATGATPEQSVEAGGGGGGGGTIHMRFAGNADCFALEAGGGAGGRTTETDPGPGGGGGGGYVFFQAAGGLCAPKDNSILFGNAGAPRSGTTTAKDGTNGHFVWRKTGFVRVTPDIQTPSNGAVLSASPTAISGTAESNSTLTLELTGPNGTTTYSLPVNNSTPGNWILNQPTLPVLPDGTYTVTVRTTSVDGDTSPTVTSTFTVDTIAPTVAITAPANGRTSSQEVTEVTGTAEPGSKVTVVVEGTTYSNITVPASGIWTVTLNSPLKTGGPYTATATATDAAGNTATDTSTFRVDTTAPAVTIDAPANGGNPLNTPVTTVTGTAEIGSKLTVEVGGTTYTDVPVSGIDGSWTITLNSPLTNGTYTATATATDAVGNSATATSTFTVDTTPPAVAITAPANGGTSSTNVTEVTGTAEPGSKVTVVVGGTTYSNVPVVNGSWTVTLNSPLTNGGPYTATASATDAAGNSATATSTFSVDTQAPAAPVVTGPANGDIVTDTTPIITGTAEPNTTVTVIIDDVVVGTAPVDGSGNWSYTPSTPLSLEEHKVTARTQDAAGNTSPESAPSTFTVVIDTNITTGPEGTTPNRNATFEFDSGQPGVTYECRLDGGEWTPCTSPVTYDNLPDGEHTFEVRSRDSAGNVDATPATRTWTVHVGDIDFRGDGLGCSASGGDSSLVLMALGSVLALARRRRQR